MIGELLKIGLPTAIAILLTVGAVAWVEPNGIGGVVILFVISLALTFVVRAVIRRQ